MMRNLLLFYLVICLPVMGAAQTPSVKTLANFNFLNGAFPSSTLV